VLQGKLSEAREAFDTLEKAASTTTLEARAEVRFTRLLYENGVGVEMDLERVEAVDSELKTTAAYHYWVGRLHPMPLTALVSLETSLQKAKPGTYVYRWATLVIAERRAAIGQEEAALEVLRAAIRSADAYLRMSAAEKWLELFPSIDAMAKLILLVVGLTGNGSSTLSNQAVELSINELAAIDSSFCRRLQHERRFADVEAHIGSSVRRTWPELSCLPRVFECRKGWGDRCEGKHRIIVSLRRGLGRWTRNPRSTRWRF
jgi:hypothetical protein